MENNHEGKIYKATFNHRWRGTIYDASGKEIENSGDEFFVSDLAVFRWAKSKGVIRQAANK